MNEFVNSLIAQTKTILFGEGSTVDDIAGKLDALDISAARDDEDIDEKLSGMSIDPVKQFIQSPILNNYLQQFIMEHKYLILENKGEPLLPVGCENVYKSGRNKRAEQDPDIEILLQKMLADKANDRIFSQIDANGSKETIAIAQSIADIKQQKHAEKAQWEGIINYICNYTIPNFMVSEYYTYKLDKPIVDFMRSTNFRSVYDEYLTNKDLYYLCDNTQIVNKVVDEIPAIRKEYQIGPDTSAAQIKSQSHDINQIILKKIWDTYVDTNKTEILTQLNNYKKRFIHHTFFNTLFDNGPLAWEKYRRSSIDVKTELDKCILSFNNEQEKGDTPPPTGDVARLAVLGDKMNVYKDLLQKIDRQDNNVRNILFPEESDDTTVDTATELPGSGFDFDTFMNSLSFDQNAMFYNADGTESDDESQQQAAMIEQAEEFAKTEPEPDTQRKRAKIRRKGSSESTQEGTSSANVSPTCGKTPGPQNIFNDVDKCILEMFKEYGGKKWDMPIDASSWAIAMELSKEQNENHNLLKCMYYILYKWATEQM